jgi:hypothetical protein
MSASPTRRLRKAEGMGKAVAVVYLALVGLLIFGAVGIWRIRCEGFGCTGVGVAWLAWVALFVPSLVIGLVLRTLSSLGVSLTQLTKLALWLQVGTGAALLALWASKSAV